MQIKQSSIPPELDDPGYPTAVKTAIRWLIEWDGIVKMNDIPEELANGISEAVIIGLVEYDNKSKMFMLAGS